MNAPGKGILKTVSILFIIFGAIATVISLAAMVGSAMLTTTGTAGFALGGIMLIATVVLMIVSVLELILGIVGLKKCNNPEKAGYFITTGIILSVISLVPLFIGISNGGFSITSLISFVLPVLYIIGGYMNKKVVREY